MAYNNIYCIQKIKVELVITYGETMNRLIGFNGNETVKHFYLTI